MTITYYPQTLRLLGLEPRPSPRAVAAVERTEASHGARLPTAVREFYTLDGFAARLHRPGWCAGAVPLGEFLRRFRQTVSRRGSDQPARPAVRFYQDGGNAVRVQLTGDDDPPTDSSGPYPGMGLNLPDGQSLNFSGFIRRAAWSARTDHHYTAYVGLGDWPGGEGVVGPPHIDFLLERYEEWVRTPQLDREPPPTGPGADHHCFFGPSARIQLRTAGDPTVGMVPGCWWLHADSEAALFDLYAELRPAHGPPVIVEGPVWSPGGQLRRRFRKRFPAVRLKRP